jgi:membrane-associated PAP2 superfamily phosphatase
MLTSARARFYGLNLGIPLVCAAVVFLLFDMTRIDIAFSDLFYDPLHQVFPLGHVRLFELDRRGGDYRGAVIVRLAAVPAGKAARVASGTG